MDGGTTISQQIVDQLAEDLTAEGRSATCRGLREAMKEKEMSGTNESVRAYLANWKEKKKRGGIDSIEDLPDEIGKLGLGFLGRVWEISVRDASVGHEALRWEMVAARNASDEREEVLAQHISMLEADLESRIQRAIAAETAAEKACADMQLAVLRAVEAERELARMTERSNGLEEKVLLLERSLGEGKDSLKKIQTELLEAGKAAAGLRELIAMQNGVKETLESAIVRERELNREANERAMQAEERTRQACGRADRASADLQSSTLALAEKERAYLDTRQSLDEAMSLMAHAMDDGMNAARNDKTSIAKIA